MTSYSYTWIGGTKYVNDPTAWSPTGVPGPSDYATLSSGNILANNQTISPDYLLIGSTAPGGATINAFESTITGSIYNLDPDPSATLYSTIGFVGANGNSGAIEAGVNYLDVGSFAYFDIDLADLTNPAGVVIQRAVLTNTGAIGVSDLGKLTINGPADSEIANTGSISIYESQLLINTAITGTGTITVDGFRGIGRLALGGAVAAGQTVQSHYGILTLTDPLNFRATVDSYEAPTNLLDIELPGVAVTSAYYIANVLTLMSGSTVAAQFKLASGTTEDDFAIVASASGTRILPSFEGTSNVPIQTTGTAPAAPPIVLPAAVIPLPNTGPDLTLTTGAKTASVQKLDGYSVRLEGTSAATAPSVNTTSTVFGANFHLLVQGQPSGPTYGTYAAVGYNENDGTIETATSHAGGAATLAFSITDVVSPTGSTILTGAYNNVGTIDAEAGTTIDITGSAASKLVNSGQITALGSLVLGANITGTGSMTVGTTTGTSGSLEAGGPVSTGQSITLNAGTLTIDNAAKFSATIFGFDAKDTIVLKGLDVTSVSYNNGALLLDGGTDGTLHFRRPVGVTFDTASFALGHTASGDTTITFKA